MGDQNNPNPTPFSLPPGCRFYPSDEQLVCYYLTHKNNGDYTFGFDVIKEIDLYNYEPFDLPETTCFRFGRGGRKRHWYCYAEARVLMERGRRPAGGGYWRRKGPVRDVVDGGAGKVVVGTRKTFVYYLGYSPKTAVRTDWVMCEYSLIDQKLASFVLCRVFVKSVRRNSISEHAFSSCGEESVATVRHVGVQHDDTIRLGFGDTKAHKGDPLDHHDILTFPMGTVCELNDRVSGGPDGGQTKAPGHISGHSLMDDSLSAEQLMAILEDDYIELDDLVCPCPGID